MLEEPASEIQDSNECKFHSQMFEALAGASTLHAGVTRE